MAFDEMISLLSKAIGIELQIVDGVCGFKAGEPEDDDTSVNIMISNVEERGEVLLYADLGDVPPEGREDFYRTLLEANNLFQGTGGATSGKLWHIRQQCRGAYGRFRGNCPGLEKNSYGLPCQQGRFKTNGGANA